MHVTRGDRAQQKALASPSQGEGDENASAIVGFADAYKALFNARMLGIGKDSDRPFEKASMA